MMYALIKVVEWEGEGALFFLQNSLIYEILIWNSDNNFSEIFPVSCIKKN